MTLPKNRSRRVIKTVRKTAKRTTQIFVKKRINKTKCSCAICKSALAGIRTGSRTQRSVSRPFGGYLCHLCITRIIKQGLRVNEKAKTMEEVDIVYRKYVQPLIKQ